MCIVQKSRIGDIADIHTPYLGTVSKRSLRLFFSIIKIIRRGTFEHNGKIRLHLCCGHGCTAGSHFLLCSKTSDNIHRQFFMKLF